MLARRYSIRATALALVAAAGCGNGAIAPTAGRLTRGSAAVSATVEAAGAGSVARISLEVSQGNGPPFPFRAITADLTRTGPSWSAFLTGIPVGRERRFEVVALDASGARLASGTGMADIVGGSPSQVTIVLTIPGKPVQNQAPVIDYLTASANEVEAGKSLAVGASAHDPDPSDSLSYRWGASCGTFEEPTATVTIWTAPPAPGSCRLTLTVSDGQIAVEAPLDVVVRGRSVSGSRLVTHWPDPPAAALTAPAPDNAASLPPQVLVADGAGGWRVLPGGHTGPGGTFVEGSFGADGSFLVPDVPAGGYVLCHRPAGAVTECIEGSGDTVDLGFDLLGRADQLPATVHTPVAFQLSGLDPWNPLLERIEVTSSGANLWEVIAHGPELRGGAVSGTVTRDWHSGSAGGQPLSLLVPGDLLVAHQLSARSFYTGADIHFYAAATHASPRPPDPGALTGLALRDGDPASVVAQLAALPLSASLPVDWDPAAFEAHRAALGPAGRTALGTAPHAFSVAASAGALEYPAAAAAGAPALVSMKLPPGAARAAGTVYYGRFLDTRWREWREVRFDVEVALLAPAATQPLVERAGLVRRDALPVPPGTLGPALTPVASPRIGGLDAFADASGVGESPAFSWAPPAVGEPTAYVVEIYRLEARAGATAAAAVLRYTTARPGLTVPPGLLARGESYFARITAEASTVPPTAPFRTAHLRSRASTLTGVFTP